MKSKILCLKRYLIVIAIDSSSLNKLSNSNKLLQEDVKS